jgi:large subunit ribosomal protein L31
MKDKIHPVYRPVVFQDASCGFTFLTRSTVRTNQTTTWEDGKEYPLVVVDVSQRLAPVLHGQDQVRGCRRAGRQVQQEVLGTYGKAKKEAAKS